MFLWVCEKDELRLMYKTLLINNQGVGVCDMRVRLLKLLEN
jgi:hypothetical protein